MAKKHMYLYGRNSVTERLKSRPETIRWVYLREGLSVPELENLIRLRDIHCERRSSEDIDKMRPQKDLQGVVAQVDLFRYADGDVLVDQALRERRTLIFADHVNDPHNLGVIIRLAACFGPFSLVIPSRAACQVNETVLHVASGGENSVPIASVDDLAALLGAARTAGFTSVGAVAGDDAQDISTFAFPFPLALVLGSEGAGIDAELEQQLDLRARIPMPGAPLSLNVAMASAIFLYEISKQMNGTT